VHRVREARLISPEHHARLVETDGGTGGAAASPPVSRTGMGYQVRRAASFAAYCLNSAAAFSIASASVPGIDVANPCLFGAACR
jgi:hypothetical protein